MILSELIRVSQTIGRHVPQWTQGKGSNISVKETLNTKECLHIKASGFRLDAVNDSQGVASVDCQVFKKYMTDHASANDQEKTYADAIGHASIHKSIRPSMETGFHIYLPRKWVMHFHSLVSVLMAQKESDEPGLIGRFLEASGFNARFLPAIAPGYQLSHLLKQCAEADVICLKNHGVILHSESSSILDKWKQVEFKFCDQFGFNKSLCATDETTADLQKHYETLAIPPKIYFPDTAVFWDDLSKILEKEGHNNFKLNRTAWTVDRNCAEIWLATLMLYDANTLLDEVPKAISESVGNLPTEQIRKLTETRMSDAKTKN